MRQGQRISAAAPDLTGNEERYVVDAVRSTWISSTGPYVDRFESEFAAMCAVQHVTGVANGTVALHLACLALGAGPGDEVLVPSLTYIATANAVRYTGAEPVFVDVDEATWCIDPDRIRELITPRTKGIIAVHLYGHPADMDAINALAAEHHLWVIEDAAEAHGARYRGRPVGGLATIATFSFYGNKIITSGEGGAVATRDDTLASKMRLLRGQGMDPARRYYFPIVGYNYRLTNVAAAILCAQLERLGPIVAARRRVFDGYADRLAGVPGIGFQPTAAWAHPAPWMFCITIDERLFGRSRDELAAVLDEAGIETRPFFRALHSLPPYAGSRHGPLDTTERLALSGINLPTHHGLTDGDLDRIAAAIVDVQRGGRQP